MNGEGARLNGGRYNSRGTAVAYVAGSISLALLEILVHVEREELLPAYVLCRVEFEESLVERYDTELLPSTWSASPPPFEVQAIGDAWVRESRSAVLELPSAVIPSESHYLVNPAHPDFSSLRLHEPEPFELDERLGG